MFIGRADIRMSQEFLLELPHSMFRPFQTATTITPFDDEWLPIPSPLFPRCTSPKMMWVPGLVLCLAKISAPQSVHTSHPAAPSPGS